MVYVDLTNTVLEKKQYKKQFDALNEMHGDDGFKTNLISTFGSWALAHLKSKRYKEDMIEIVEEDIKLFFMDEELGAPALFIEYPKIKEELKSLIGLLVGAKVG